MRKKFKIYYGKDNPDPEKAGKRYKPTGMDMLVLLHSNELGDTIGTIRVLSTTP